MRNNKGSAVAMVLLVLAVVTLIGLALMSQSLVDIQFTTSVKSYEKMFNLADGAAEIAYKRLPTAPEVPFEGSPVSNSLYEQDQKVTKVGSYLPYVIMQGFSTDPQDSQGWELGKEGFHAQWWVASGAGKRTKYKTTEVTGEEQKTVTVPPAETAVQVAARKMQKNL
jgi:hypothetical protein